MVRTVAIGIQDFEQIRKSMLTKFRPEIRNRDSF